MPHTIDGEGEIERGNLAVYILTASDNRHRHSGYESRFSHLCSRVSLDTPAKAFLGISGQDVQWRYCVLIGGSLGGAISCKDWVKIGFNFSVSSRGRTIEGTGVFSLRTLVEARIGVQQGRRSDRAMSRSAGSYRVRNHGPEERKQIANDLKGH